MSSLRLFGGFDLEMDSGTPTRALPTRRAEAVLAVLAVHGDRGCSRTRLIALLWPGHEAPRAGHHLRDSLYLVRRGLSRDAVVRRGDMLRLDPRRVESDVRAFTDAIASCRLREAVALYRGPLLDGFDPGVSPEFERWVDGERGRYARECREAVTYLAALAEQAGRWEEAAAWWARATVLDPFNSRLVLRRMVALTRGGDPANALVEGEAHCRMLLSELELEPDPSFLEAMERIRTGRVRPSSFFTSELSPTDRR